MKKLLLCLVLVALFVTGTSAKRSSKKCKPLPLTSIHLVDRNGFSETISAKDRLQQMQNTDFLKPMPYQKVLRIFARDCKGNVRSVVTSYHENGNPKQLLEILNGRAYGMYQEWHENGSMRISTRVVGGTPDITQLAEQTWLFDGISQAWDEDGHPTAEIPYSQGELQGASLYYHPSGQIWKKVPYQKGQVDGTVEIYKDGGELLQQISYCQGNKNGTTLRYWNPTQVAAQEEYNKGLLENGQYYDKNGCLISEIKQGLGYRATFGKESVHELQQYQDGILEGEVKVFTQQGNLKRIYHIKNNLKHGEEIEYYDIPITSISNNEAPPNPLPKLSFHWYDGKIHGATRTWYPNGNLESQREIANNKKHGVATVWYRDNNLMIIEEYEQGKLMRGEYYKKGERTPFTQINQGKGTASIFDAEGNFVQKINYTNGKPDDK